MANNQPSVPSAEGHHEVDMNEGLSEPVNAEGQPLPMLMTSNIPALDKRPSVIPDVCLEGCNKEDGQYVRCVLCTQWYHAECLQLPECEINGVWSCKKCRYIATEVAEVRAIAQALLQQQTAMMDIINLQKTQIDKFVTLQTNTSGLLKDIECNVKDIKDNITEETDSESDYDEDVILEPEGQICYGDSLIRDCIPNTEELEFERAGPYINNVKKTLKKKPEKILKKEMIFVIGTNDASTKKPIEKISSDCEELVQEALKRAEKVTLSSIPPRGDDKVENQKRLAINDSFRQIAAANEDRVSYVDNDKNFTYQDSSIDTAMLSTDMLHLSSKGTDQLIKNLKLDAKPSKSRFPTHKWAQNNEKHSRSFQNQHHNISSSRPLKKWPGIRNLPHKRKERLFRSGREPFSNFYMCTLKVWGKIFKSLEHAYQWKKGEYLGKDYIASRIMSADTPSDAKKIADKELHTEHTDWYHVKKEIMYELLLAKVSQCPQMKTELSNSGDDILIENTNHEYWARGKKGTGLNMLGTLLMVIRDELKENMSDEYRPPMNGVQKPCFNCGEGNHVSLNCRHQGALHCKHCYFSGHKIKDCPDRV